MSSSKQPQKAMSIEHEPIRCLSDYVIAFLKIESEGPDGPSALACKAHPLLDDLVGAGRALGGAIFNGHTEYAVGLIKCGASNALTEKGCRPFMHIAAMKGDLDVGIALLERGKSLTEVSIGLRDGDKTPIDIAHMYDHSKWAEQMVPLEASIKAMIAIDAALKQATAKESGP